MEYVMFIWDGKKQNYINVCLESLRLHNKTCKIIFYTNLRFEKYNIIYKDLPPSFNKKRMFYKIKLANELLKEIEENSNLLVLDCDLLFQNDPFKMFDNHNDLYYTTCVMNIWREIDYPVNGGVWGIKNTLNSKKLMNFWVSNLLKPEWDKWINYKYRKEHSSSGLDWWVDQDFLNCIHNHSLPFEIKIKNIGFKYNYFTSKWGCLSKYLEMNNKIGNSNYVIIHFKGSFKETYNVNNSKIYNMKNILDKKILYTKNEMNKIKQRIEQRKVRGKYWCV